MTRATADIGIGAGRVEEQLPVWQVNRIKVVIVTECQLLEVSAISIDLPIVGTNDKNALIASQQPMRKAKIANAISIC